MIYKQFRGKDLSNLGMGAMRLPVIDGDDSRIDVQATEAMVAYAMENGINYYDTAWGYHGGQSESVLGKALSRYPRSDYYLASKFPGYDLSNMDIVEDIFEEQLKKCGVDYFDFYLFHNVCEMNIDAYLDEAYGIMDYLYEQKKNGRIGHLGFSAHGSIEVIGRFLKAYGDKMEFGQLQLNYLDWTFQDSMGKVALLNQYDIPVWVMEPLRGGKLASLSKEHTEILNALRPDEKIPGWAFQFLRSIPSVTMILSGMSNDAQMRENIEIFKKDQRLNNEEMKAILGIADDMLSKKTLPCTACNYCVSHCPQSLNIPALIGLYNEHRFTEGGFIAPMALMALPEEKKPSACIGCNACEQVCPQQIQISDTMEDFVTHMGM